MLNRSQLSGWFFGFLFGLYGIGAVTQGSWLSGVAGLVFAALIIPPSRQAVFQRLPWQLPHWAKLLITVLVFFLMAMTVEAEPAPQNAGADAVPQASPSQRGTPSPTVTMDAQATVSPIASPLASPAVLATTSAGQAAERQAATLVRVVDGDTIQVELNGRRQTVRLIGINTPEVVDPRRSPECFGREASNEAKRFLTEVGPQLWLEADPSQANQDRYNRLLRYVFVREGQTDLGLHLIQQGYANEYTYDQAYRYQAAYRQAEVEAQTAGRGLWADGVCAASPPSRPQTQEGTSRTVNRAASSPTIKHAAAPVPAAGAAGGVSCTGPDLDCGDFSSRAEMSQFWSSCGFSASYDPHRLDGNDDGVPCERL